MVREVLKKMEEEQQEKLKELCQMSEGEHYLALRTDNVNLTDLDTDSTYEIPIINDLHWYGKDGWYMSPEYDDNFVTLKKIMVIQALIDNLSASTKGLCLRWLVPDLDLVDSYDNQIKEREWWVPANGRMFEPDPDMTVPEPRGPIYHDATHPTDSELETYKRYIERYQDYKKAVEDAMRANVNPRERFRQTIFETNACISRNDRKVMVLFGAGFGNGASHTITSIAIKRGDRATLGIVSLSHLKDGQAAAFDRPYLFKRNDDCRIIATLPENGWQGRRDHLILYGFICEAAGANQFNLHANRD